MLHTYLGETIRYEIKYKNRTSIGITIDGYGNIEILAPKKTSDVKYWSKIGPKYKSE